MTILVFILTIGPIYRRLPASIRLRLLRRSSRAVVAAGRAYEISVDQATESLRRFLEAW